MKKERGFPSFLGHEKSVRARSPRWGGSAYALLAPLGASAHPRLGVCADALMAREEVEYSPRQRCLTTLGRHAGHTPVHRRKPPMRHILTTIMGCAVAVLGVMATLASADVM